MKIEKKYEELSVNTVAFISFRCKLMKATVLTENSLYFFNFHLTLSAPPMSTDVSQVGVAFFSSF